ncbi:hypothetical protein [Maritimibacter sp. UBA3975]|uniref:hypothetical protein n=1 Tax=Maritimibacter sp. UBA3975 TaxID=1946833 RepID=UPI000C09415E|nr:hypothetical protein [Maritimibacter sp. UBA3975]MAM60683.1 hypothetical protein [Maritimibacter sp.]|tara:strand:+ start:2900 stop:3241 length:342 start_codon:yes stop_codon:yes gene_type:complete
MKRIALATVLTLAPLAAQADITAFCRVLPGTEPAQCACATEKLRAQVSGSEVALYDAVTKGYLANRATGQGWLKAWRAAVAAVAQQNGMPLEALKASLDQTGAVHRALGDTCK